MILIAKTINRRDAEERAERMREYIRLGKSSDTVEVKEFMTASGSRCLRCGCSITRI